MSRKILIIEDEQSLGFALQHFFHNKGYTVRVCSDGSQGCAAIKKGAFDVILTDLRLPLKNGFAVLQKAREISPEAAVIMMTAYADIKDAVQAIQLGAYDYLTKPFSNDEVELVIDRYFELQNLRNEVSDLRQQVEVRNQFAEIIGSSQPMQDVFDRMQVVAATDAPVLILGESGTGKELVANGIHQLSVRNKERLIKINCAAIPATLFEAELFGHERGAFTGAHQARAGKLEHADHGTIFFDEVAEVPLSLQAKLLRALEEGCITRLGSNDPIPVDIRAIYATSRNLRELIESKQFREDLYYRINVVTITIPPLRSRSDDIPHLIEHFSKYYAAKTGKHSITYAPEAFDALLAYSYPGNVRELKHAIESAVVFAQNGNITVDNLPEWITQDARDDSCFPDGTNLADGIKVVEQHYIRKALRESGGNRMEAARLLGISRKTLWVKLREYGL